MIIMPAIDLMRGRVVRLQQGDFRRVERFEDDPVALAQAYEKAGAEWLHLVDLDGARSGEPQNLDALRAIRAGTGLKIQAGGGMRSKAHMQQVKEAGAYRLAIGSLALKDPGLVQDRAEKLGPDGLVIALDVRMTDKGPRIAVKGWTEELDADFMEMLDQFLGMGLSRFLITDIGRDGMMEGPNTDFYAHLAGERPKAKICASGGIRGMDDLRALKAAGLDALVIGKALLSGQVRAGELFNAG